MTVNSQERSPNNTVFQEEKADGIRNIVVKGTLQRPTTEKLVALFEQSLRDATQPFILVHIDLSDPSIQYTPYSRQRGQEAFEKIPDDKMLFLAVSVGGERMVNVARMIIRQDENRYDNMCQNVFTNRADAVQWLCACARKYQAEQ